MVLKKEKSKNKPTLQSLVHGKTWMVHNIIIKGPILASFTSYFHSLAHSSKRLTNCWQSLHHQLQVFLRQFGCGFTSSRFFNTNELRSKVSYLESQHKFNFLNLITFDNNIYKHKFCYFPVLLDKANSLILNYLKDRTNNV